MTIWDGVQRGYIPGETLRIPGTLKLHTGTADVDPVTFEVIRYSLMNTNLEHGQTIQRLAVSPVTMITRDFQPSIITPPVAARLCRGARLICANCSASAAGAGRWDAHRPG